MSALISPLILAARHGRMLLVAGLIAGLALPDMALAMRPWLQELVAGLLFLAALRIGPRSVFGALRDVPETLGLALVFQLFLPVAAIAVIWLFGWHGAPLATAIVLMLSASSISGSPNLTIMTGFDPAPALRLLVLGTAILPLTMIPVLWLLPELGGIGEIAVAAGRLLAVIAAATALAFLLRGFLFSNLSAQAIAALDGASAVFLAIVVVGLMSAAGPELVHRPINFLVWLCAACAANFGLQCLSALLFAQANRMRALVPFSIIAGNRNIALFLVALPPDVTDPLLLFIGCYQIPMYLTPLIMRPVYRRLSPSGPLS